MILISLRGSKLPHEIRTTALITMHRRHQHAVLRAVLTGTPAYGNAAPTVPARVSGTALRNAVVSVRAATSGRRTGAGMIRCEVEERPTVHR
jgi:RNase P/RNase MRP subunit POP5